MSGTGCLPTMIYRDGIRKYSTVKFAGYNHTEAACDGGIYDMTNLTGDHYPVLASRKSRYRVRMLNIPNGMCAYDGLFWVDGTGFYANGVQKGMVENSRKRFCALGNYVVILPDKKYYNRLTDEFGSIESEWTGNVKIANGSYAGEDAEANTITAVGVDFSEYFREGDAIEISGCTNHSVNNRTLIIREIDGANLHFYENSFIISEDGDSENVTLSRKMPDVDFICQNENRLWACKGDTIYSSKLGDIFNWNVFDGLATDSYAVSVGSPEEFTGCFSYLGYPCFFKEEQIYKVYGDKPSSYQVMGSASLGTDKGSWNSFGISGEVLFYLSRTGVSLYSGGFPQSIAAPFGTERYKNAVGGSDGVKYYISMQDTNDKWHLFVYDTRRNLWHREDALHVIDFAWNGDLYFLDSDGTIWMNGNARNVPSEASSEGTVQSECVFGDFTGGSSNKKGASKLQMRMELSAGSTVQVAMQFDSDGVWHTVRTLSATKKRSFYLPIIPRRNDHYRIKLSGSGEWRLYSLVYESYLGSEL